MQLLFEFLPLIAFFIAYRLAGIYVATAVITGVVVLQVGYRLLRRQKLTTMQKTSAIIMLAMGGLTLLLHDDRFILWKPTIFYWAVAAGLTIGHLLTGHPVVEKLFGEHFKLSPARWSRLSWIWAGFLTFLGGLNLFVAFNYSRDTWVTFKFVLLGLFFVFVLVQSWWIVVRWQGVDASAFEQSGRSS